MHSTKPTFWTMTWTDGIWLAAEAAASLNNLTIHEVEEQEKCIYIINVCFVEFELDQARLFLQCTTYMDKWPLQTYILMHIWQITHPYWASLCWQYLWLWFPPPAALLFQVQTEWRADSLAKSGHLKDSYLKDNITKNVSASQQCFQQPISPLY